MALPIYNTIPEIPNTPIGTFVGCVLSCKSTLYIGTIQKTICAQARQLEYSLSEIV
jgi:hypothetical protein